MNSDLFAPLEPKKQFTCQICLQSYSSLEDFITLDCDHRFCSPCMKQHCRSKISQGLVSNTSLKCPMETCNVPIAHEILKGLLDRETFEQFDALLTNFYLLNIPGNSEERTICCPELKCSQTSFVHKNSQYFECKYCGRISCANDKCLGLWSEHKGKSCEEFKSAKEPKSNAILREEELMANFNYKKCPICDSLIEKTGNCNIVRCCSIRCQKKTVFCYLCGKHLQSDKIGEHFSQGSAFQKCKREGEEPEVEFIGPKECQHKVMSSSDQENKFSCDDCNNYQITIH